jgi:hypothetical protein
MPEAVRLAVSNIAWEPHEDDAVAEVLRREGVSGVEIAPTKWRARPFDASADEIAEYRRSWEDRGLRIVSLQSLLFGRSDLQLFGTDGVRARELPASRSGSACLCRCASRDGASRLAARGSRAAVEHLAGLGHVRVGYLGLAADTDTARRRERGYREGMAAANLRVDERWVGTHPTLRTPIEVPAPFRAMLEMRASGDHVFTERDVKLFETPYPNVFFIEYRANAYVPATHRLYEGRHIARITVRDGRIAGYFEVWDRPARDLAFSQDRKAKLASLR